MENMVIINGNPVAIEGERNLLEVIRKANIELPTFCYHSELSIYGACRLCLVLVEGKGIMAACSTAPEAGMVVHTETKEIREMRKINIELLLANHNRECPSCSRSANCTLQDIARRLGVDKVRYKQMQKGLPIDDSSPSLVRDPNKCVLCGDCVRVCSEVQGIGAIDFANRGANAVVSPAFNQDLGDVECVNCGQCAAVCPTGAIVPKSEIEAVWSAIYDPKKKVVVQIAPAVRVGLGEMFGAKHGENVERKMTRALKMMGFDQVYDTCFTADMTIFEEATEFLGRVTTGGVMPMFTSCCPGWVKFVETYYPEFVPNISTTRSPQAIFGAVAQKVLPERLGIDPKDLVVVSIMPCTAKKYEAQMPKFVVDGKRQVDHVLTTIEIGRMIDSMGIKLDDLEPENFDAPLDFSTGGGVIFGATGGVMEAALRYAVEKLEGKPLTQVDFKEVRGLSGRKDATVTVNGTPVRVCVVHGLGNARALLEDIKAGKAAYDFIEVMACPGGCVAGGGQPIAEYSDFRNIRAAGLYRADKERQLQKPQENHLVEKCYTEYFGGGPGSHEAHHKLHTHYVDRGQVFHARMPILRGTQEPLLPICVTVAADRDDCPGQLLLAQLVEFITKNNYTDRVELEVAFRPRIKTDVAMQIIVGDQIVEGTLDAATKAIKEALK